MCGCTCVHVWALLASPQSRRDRGLVTALLAAAGEEQVGRPEEVGLERLSRSPEEPGAAMVATSSEWLVKISAPPAPILPPWRLLPLGDVASLVPWLEPLEPLAQTVGTGLVFTITCTFQCTCGGTRCPAKIPEWACSSWNGEG